MMYLIFFFFQQLVLLTRNDREYDDIIHPLKNDDIIHFSFKIVYFSKFPNLGTQNKYS